MTTVTNDNSKTKTKVLTLNSVNGGFLAVRLKNCHTSALTVNARSK